MYLKVGNGFSEAWEVICYINDKQVNKLNLHTDFDNLLWKKNTKQISFKLDN